MFSVKKIIKQILGISLLLILMVFTISFILVPATKSELSEVDQAIQNIETDILSLDLPVRVIKNVAEQIEKDKKNLDNINLIDAYERNLLQLQQLSTSIMEASEALKSDFQLVNRYSLGFYQSDIGTMIAQVEELSSLNDETLQVLKRSKPSDSDIMTLEALVMKSVSLADSLHNNHQQLDSDILTTYTLLNSIMLGLLLIILLLMSLGIYKYITSDLHFILESFNKLSDKVYDEKQLPETKPIFKEDRLIQEKVHEIFTEERFVQSVREMLLNTYHIDDLIQQLFQRITEVSDIKRIGIAFVDYSRQKFIAEYGISSYQDILLGPGFEVDFDRTSLSELLRTKQSVISNDLEADFKMKPRSAALRLIREEGIASNMAVPVLMGEVVFGIMFFSSTEKNYFTAAQQHLAEKIIYEIGGFLNRSYFTKVILSRITNSFSVLVDKKDNETGDHILRMVAYSTIIAKGLMNSDLPGYDVNEKFVLEIERNASSHDIGKVGIPDEILKKPGKLDPEEWTIMKTHTTIGADIFKSLREGLQVFDADFYKVAEEIARYHHEKWDGSGYPEGLKEQAIPLSARIVALADVFDALTSKRHYKDAFKIEKSLKIIKDSAGSHLDPTVVEVFLEHLDEILHIHKRYN